MLAAVVAGLLLVVVWVQPGAGLATQTCRNDASLKQRTDLSPLQKHCAFFDRDKDGYISPQDTFSGCRALGMNPLVSTSLTVLINGAQAPLTGGRWWWPPFSINLANVNRAKHGSDTGLYDEEGAFDEAKFEALFDKFDKDGDGALSWSEFLARARAQRDIYDPFGSIATVLEFAATYLIAAEDGKLSKEMMRGVYDGTLFEKVEAQVATKQAQRRRSWF
jgi:peroxygenase